MSQSAPVKIASTPSTQRQTTVSPKKPPTMGPKAGPMNGATANSVIASPLSLAGNMSAMAPPALVSSEDPNAPAQKRRIRRLSMFCDLAALALKAAKTAYVMKYSICWP